MELLEVTSHYWGGHLHFPKLLPAQKIMRRICFCTIWIYAYVRMVSHNDNRNYSASKK